MDALIRRDDDDDDDDDGGDASDGGLKPTPSTTWMAALAREFAAIGNRGTLAEGLRAMRARQLEQARARRQTAAWRSGAQLCASTCVCFATFFYDAGFGEKHAESELFIDHAVVHGGRQRGSDGAKEFQ